MSTSLEAEVATFKAYMKPDRRKHQEYEVKINGMWYYNEYGPFGPITSTLRDRRCLKQS